MGNRALVCSQWQGDELVTFHNHVLRDEIESGRIQLTDELIFNVVRFTRKQGERALNYLAGYVGQGTVEQLATCVDWWYGRLTAEKISGLYCGTG